MAVEVASSDRKAVPITWDTALVEGEHAELWAKNPDSDEEFEVKKKIINDGTAHVNFPVDYTGQCAIQIRGENDTADEGVITVE